MIRKGLRARVRPALRWPAQGGPRLVWRFRRAWIAIVVVSAMAIAFWIPAVLTWRSAARNWSGFSDLFDLVFAIFQSAWLLGWAIAPLLLTLVLALLLFGRETARVRDGTLDIFLGLPLIGVVARYRLANLRNLRIEPAGNPSTGRGGNRWRGTHLAFDYGANTIAVGSAVTGTDQARLHGWITEALGKPPRSGAAQADELAGDWAPGLVAESGAAAADGLAAEPKPPSGSSALALVLANAVTLAGAAWLGWDLGHVMVLYWAESAIIGLYNLAKLAVVGRAFALLAGPFFLAHFGAFMAVHFLFVYGLFVQGPQNGSGAELAEVGALLAGLWPALAALFLSHGYSFARNFLARGEYRRRTVRDLMTEPYARIMLMHLVLILGGGLVLLLGSPTPVLVAVIVLKTAFDLRAHRGEHGRDSAGEPFHA